MGKSWLLRGKQCRCLNVAAAQLENSCQPQQSSPASSPTNSSSAAWFWGPARYGRKETGPGTAGPRSLLLGVLHVARMTRSTPGLRG